MTEYALPMAVLIGLAINKTLEHPTHPASRVSWIVASMFYLLPMADQLRERLHDVGEQGLRRGRGDRGASDQQGRGDGKTHHDDWQSLYVPRAPYNHLRCTASSQLPSCSSPRSLQCRVRRAATSFRFVSLWMKLRESSKPRSCQPFAPWKTVASASA